MPLQGQHTVALRHVPYTDTGIPRGGGQPGSIRVEADPRQPVGVALPRGDELSFRKPPEPPDQIVTSTCQHLLTGVQSQAADSQAVGLEGGLGQQVNKHWTKMAKLSI